MIETATYTIPEAAVVLGTTRWTLGRAIADGKFPVPAIKIRSKTRLPKSKVDALANGDLA